jgi:hypothetical protein
MVHQTIVGDKIIQPAMFLGKGPASGARWFKNQNLLQKPSNCVFDTFFRLQMLI